MRQGGPKAAAKMRASPKRPPRGAQVQGATAANTRRPSAAWIRWQFGPCSRSAARHQQHLTRASCSTRQDHRPAEDGTTRRCSATRRLPHDRSGRPRLVGLERAERPRDRTDHRPGTAATTPAVWPRPSNVNNNGHSQFDAGTMVSSYRLTRDEQHLTRGRANTLRCISGSSEGASLRRP